MRKQVRRRLAFIPDANNGVNIFGGAMMAR